MSTSWSDPHHQHLTPQQSAWHRNKRRKLYSLFTQTQASYHWHLMKQFMKVLPKGKLRQDFMRQNHIQKVKLLRMMASEEIRDSICVHLVPSWRPTNCTSLHKWIYPSAGQVTSPHCRGSHWTEWERSIFVRSVQLYLRIVMLCIKIYCITQFSIFLWNVFFL